MALLDPTGHIRQRLRHRPAMLVAAAIVAIGVVATTSPTPAGAAEEPPGAVETLNPTSPGRLELGPDTRRQDHAPVPDGSGAYVYRRGRFRPLSPISDASTTLTYGINNRGQTTGLYVNADAAPNPDGTLPSGSVRGFVRDRRGRITSFDVADASYTRPLGINNRGQLAGDYADAGTVPGPDGLRPPGSIHGFVRDPRGRITTFDVPFRLHVIRGINDRGQIVGYYDNPDLTQGGFVREPGGHITRITVPGASYTQVYGINNRGQVVGAYLEPGTAPNPDGTVPPGAVHGFVWERGRIRSVDVPGATATQAFGVNNRGQIVGGYRDTNGHQHGFLLDRGRYRTIDAPGRSESIGTLATTINDRGEIVIPEPGVEGVVPVAT